MSGCLGERTLWLIHQGEGPASDQAHLRACLSCAARYQRLTQDLRVIDQALRGAPPVPAVLRPLAARGRAVAVAAALAAMVLVGGFEVWLWRESVSWVQPRADAGETDVFLEQVAAVLSSTGDASGAAIAMLPPPLDFGDVLAAPEGEWAVEGEPDSLGGS